MKERQIAPSLSFKQFGVMLLLALHVINAVFAMIVIMEKDVVFEYRTWFFLYSAFVFIYSLITKFDNLLFATRTLFLGVVGYYPMLIKTLDPEGLFSLFEPSTQGWEVVSTMYGLTSLALLGNELGLLAGSIGFSNAGIRKFIPDKLNYQVLFYCSMLLVLLVAYLTEESAGPSLFLATYASEAQPQLLGITQAMGTIGLLAMMLAMNKTNIQGAKVLLLICVLYYLGWAMFFHGLRQDVLTALLGLYIVNSMTLKKSPRIGAIGIIVIVALVMVFELWGTMRASLATEGFEPLTSVKSISDVIGDSHYFHLSTLSAIDTTLANTIYLVQSGQVDFLYGKSFFEFILRTPPEFLYPDRPTDYAWMFQDFGLVASGGFYELAEAYLNFGLMGGFFIPLILSFLISRAYWGAFTYQTIWRYFLLFSFLGIWMRGTWYQIFAFYKTFMTSVILFIAFWIIVNLVRLVKMRRIQNTLPNQS